MKILSKITLFKIALLAIFCFSVVSPQKGLSLPKPEPTNIAGVKQTNITVNMQVPLPYGFSKEDSSKIAKTTSELEGYYKLLQTAFKPLDSQASIFIDGRSQYSNAFGWLSSTRLSPLASDGAYQLSGLTWNKYESKLPGSIFSTAKDLNGDGTKETIIIKPDSSVAVLSENGRVLALTSPFSSFEASSAKDGDWHLPSKKRVFFRRLVGVKDCRYSQGVLSFTAVMQKSESIYGCFAASSFEDLPLEMPANLSPEAPVIHIYQPSSQVFSHKKVPFKGLLDAPSGILNAQVLLNGVSFWHTPIDFSASFLELDLYVNLKPGQNTINVELTDKLGRKAQKTVEVYAPLAKPKRTHAVLVGLDNVGDSKASCKGALSDLSNLRQTLIDLGCSVKTIRGEDATYENIEKALNNLKSKALEGDRVLLYWSGLTGIEKGKKVLLPYGCYNTNSKATVINAAYVKRFLDSLPNCSTLIILDTCAKTNNSSLPLSYNDNWAYTDKFGSEIEGYGRSFLSSSDPSSQVRIDGLEQGILTRLYISEVFATKDPFKAALSVYSQCCRESCERAYELKQTPVLPILRNY